MTMKNIKSVLTYFIIAITFFMFISFAYSAKSQSTTFDFSSRAEQASFMKLAAETTEPTSEKQQEKQQEKQPEEQSRQTNDKQDEIAETTNNEAKPEIIQQAERKTNDAPGATEQLSGEQANHIEVTDDADQQNRYFTTNLVDGLTVTEALFYVTLTHLDESLTMQQLDVYMNGQLLENYDGELQFNEGKNVVKFAVTYEKENGQIVTAQQQYTITLNTNDVVIFTNLQNKTVDEEKLTFTASAKLKNEEAKVTVSLNGRTISPLGETVYSVELEQGKNEIVIEATRNNKKTTKRFEVVYEEEATAIQLETNLSEHHATEASYSFYATATANKQPVPLTVKFNEQTINASSDGQYSVTLKHGVNTVHISGNYQSEKISKQYRIIYKDPAVVEEEKVDPKAPKLVTDLKDGTKVKGDIKTINVWPTNASGERIRGKNVLVKVNGTAVPFTWDDSEKTSYKLVLKEGENNVSIKVWDDEGRNVTQNFTVHSEQIEDNGVIGQATISVEASTLGIQYLIPPTKVDIHKGEKGSFIVDQLFRQYGYSYRITGTLSDGFYLKSISKPGMLNHVRIPDDLWTLVEKHSTRSDRNDYSTDSLGEFDFANGSGWMYSVNGDYPNYGFSDAYFLDGDVVRIRYTLHYGKDINGFSGLGGGADSEWNKQW